MNKLNQYVVVASNSTAKIYYSSPLKHKFVLVKVLENPTGKMHKRELFDDKPSMQGNASGRHMLGMHGDPRERSMKNFATEIGHTLEHEIIKHPTENVLFVASPRFLGILRKKLKKHCVQMKKSWHAKDLVKVSDKLLYEYLSAAT